MRSVADAIEIEAETPIRDLCVLAELADPACVASDGMLALLPGERVTIPIAGGAPSEAALRGAWRSANALSGRLAR
jgi:hypothetical protein